MGDAFWDAIDSEREEQKKQRENILIDLEQIYHKHNPSFVYFFEIRGKQNIKCELVSIENYSKEYDTFRYLKGICLTKNKIKLVDQTFEFSKLETILNKYQGSLFLTR